MIHIPRWKIFTIIGICLVGILFSLPNFFDAKTVERWPSWLPHQRVVLGLDLQGGSHLLFDVDVKAVIRERMAALVDSVRTTLRKEKIGYTGLGLQPQGVSLRFRDLQDKDKAIALLKKSDPEITITSSSEGITTLSYDDKVLEGIKKKTVEQSIEIIRRRIDETGTKEPIIQRQGDDRILVQLPGVDDPAHVKALIGKTAKMAFRLVDQSVPLYEAIQGHVPAGSQLLSGAHGGREEIDHQYLVKRQVLVSGDMLVDAQPTFDEYNRPMVSFRFNSLGAKRFADATKANVGRPFAIVLDDKVISAPVINEPILGGAGVIQGHFTVQEANDLALLMRAGALPAPLNVVEERTVGPGLGADSIQAGQFATVVAIILVACFMVLVYSFFGFVANIALMFNLFLLFAALTVLQATLTLPGIAGIALTIGMAVDANVLIYERIKEELRAGRKILGAVDAGYNRAISTIIDSNLTTLIGSAVLFHFGTGPIRGFAVTLALGIVISMFTAISLSRLVIIKWLAWRKPTQLPI